MKRHLIVSIDVERDIHRYIRSSFAGVEDGLPVILDISTDAGFAPDLFIETSVAAQFPTLVRQEARRGFVVGCHGEHLDPLLATELGDDALIAHLRNGKETLESVLDASVLAYREANFAVNERTLPLLGEIGYLVDSSVLPNRLVRRRRIKTVVDHRGAPDHPYRPADGNHSAPGGFGLLEVPVSENPFNAGAPIGTGYLNWTSVEQTLRALCGSAGDPVTFLIHPWECVALQLVAESLPPWVRRICRENSRQLALLLDKAHEFFDPWTLREAAWTSGVNLA